MGRDPFVHFPSDWIFLRVYERLKFVPFSSAIKKQVSPYLVYTHPNLYIHKEYI